jgi:hypothetical protein
MADKAAICGLSDEEAFIRIVDLRAKKPRRVPFRGDLRHLVTTELSIVGRVPDLGQEP